MTLMDQEQGAFKVSHTLLSEMSQGLKSLDSFGN